MEKLIRSARAAKLSTYLKTDFKHRFLLWRVFEGGCVIVGCELQYMGDYIQ